MLFYRGQAPPDLPLDASIASLSSEVRYPLRYGYACVGRAIEIGAQVDRAWLGRRVFSFQPHTSCFNARPAELLPLPADIAPQHAVFLPNMETAVNFLQDGAPLLGERVVVLGQGVVGLLTTALLKQYPLDRLIVFDRFELRRDKARLLGASEIFDPVNDLDRAKELLGEGRADLTYELSGQPQALDLAIELTGFAGRIIIGSWYGRKSAAIDLGGRFHRSRICLISSQVSTVTPDLLARWGKARRLDVAWSMLGRVPVGDLITHTFPSAEAAQAYALFDRHPERPYRLFSLTSEGRMYTTAVKRDFVAQHYLIGGEWGAENEKHSHHYQVEVQLRGATLDQHGYLVDIVNITEALETLIAQLRDRTLNDLPEFAGLNPSIEHLARIICQSFVQRLRAPNLSGVRVQIWENDIAWSAYEQTL
jgi:6-pyruvoyl-tetrahydropterin synthase/NADPH:quinone reductase-like Zn-dependent oxidoreductase